jgi:ATP-dependent Clp protease ATP-binding subunit ClpX
MKVCSFCGKTEEQVRRIITVPTADICNECVIVCMDILIKCQPEYKEIQFKERI